MKKRLLWILLLFPASAFGQCSNTSYGAGFTCVQTAVPNQSNATTAVTQNTLTFPASTTAGNGIIAFANYCPVTNCGTGGAAIANVSISDGAGDTGWQRCNGNGMQANGLRFWYCWWLPHVGTTTTVVVAVNPSAYGLTIWAAEIAGGCNTTSCIDKDTPVAICGNPCTASVTTSNTNTLVVGFGYLAGTALAPAMGWMGMVGATTTGNPIAAGQALPGTYTPTWTSTTSTAQVIGCAIKSLTSAVPITQVTVPSMPVF